jgi:two-component system OmpR family sensor kinase
MCSRVSDSGPGIPADERERVFDRFYRGVGSDAPGSGLGLAIVRSIAERHGASVGAGTRARRPGSYGPRNLSSHPTGGAALSVA